MITSQPASKIKPNSSCLTTNSGKAEQNCKNGQVPDNIGELFAAQVAKMRAEIRANKAAKANR